MTVSGESSGTTRRTRLPRWAMENPDSPVQTNFFHRRSAVSLDVAVVGGSIDGLAAAYNLNQAGHKVRVFEKLGDKNGDPSSHRLHKVKGCMRAPPNMVKCLQQWGLLSKLGCGIVTGKVEFRDGETGSFLSSLVWHEELMKELGAEFYNLHYDDLHKMIYDLVTMAGVEVEFGAEVIDIDVEAAELKLADGRQVDADLIVGADGPMGLTRQKIAGDTDKIEIGPYATYSFIVPTSNFQADPKLAPYIGGGLWTLWMGDTHTVMIYQVRENDVLVSFNGPPVDGIERGKPVPVSKLNIAQFEENVHRIWALATTDAREELEYIQPPLQNWYSSNGKVILVGETVHAICPSSANQHALAIEDGATLGCLFSRLRSHDTEEILRLLSAYQEIRQERCETTVKADADLVRFSTIPPGPERDARNESFQQARERTDALDWTQLSDELLCEMWEEFRYAFGYDAYDAADEWWVSWGLTFQRMNAARDGDMTASSTLRANGEHIGSNITGAATGHGGFQSQTEVMIEGSG